jgi:hypothetical protein
MPVSFRYTPGVGNGAFLRALRQRGILLGARCEHCEITYLPARTFCERCLRELEPAVECGPEGTLESFTEVFADVDGATIEEPQVLGLIALDGADTLMVHRLVGLGGREPVIGERVVAVLAERRHGSILDIEGFEPVPGSA